MRLQLSLAFVFIVIIVVGISWVLAVRTTDNQFAVLISENNQQQAGFLVPLLVGAYRELGSWDALQQKFEAQYQATASWAGLAGPLFKEQGAIAFNLEQFDAWLSWNLQDRIDLEGLLDWAQRPALTSPEEIPRPFWADPNGERHADLVSGTLGVTIPPHTLNLDQAAAISRQPGDKLELVIETNPISMLMLDLRPGQQRAIVVDPSELIVVDSGRTLIGKKVDDGFTRSGVPLYDRGELIGTFVVTSQDGVYTIQQSYFLQRVREGLLFSGLTSGGIALALALGIAYRFSIPIRLLTSAALRIQAGDWGYQVKVRGRHEIGQLSHAFNQMSQHLADQRLLRTRLVDDLAHELNTPLTLMRLELQGMKDGLQTPEEAADHLIQEVDEVAELAADLIFLASRDAKPSLNVEQLDLNTLAAYTMRRFEPIAGSRVVLRFQPESDLPPLYGDADLIQRALSNLVSNAIRNTPDGGLITLKTRKNGEKLEVVVQDTGYGISSEHLPYIFDRFYRVDESRSRVSGGRGLGLSIVKQIMEDHRGFVFVDSQPGQGSTFTLCWVTQSLP